MQWGTVNGSDLLTGKRLHGVYYSCKTQNIKIGTLNAFFTATTDRATVHFFADANPLFALTPDPTNQPTIA